MRSADIIRELCGKRGISIARLEKELLLGNGTIASSKSNYMRSDRLKAIADYFGVTMEYLMTGSDASDLPAAIVLTDQEEELLGIFRYLSNKEELLKYARFLKEGEKVRSKKALDA